MIKSINSSYGIGVDIGGTKTLIIISDSTGLVVFKDRFKTASNIAVLLNLIQKFDNSGQRSARQNNRHGHRCSRTGK